MKYLLRVRRRCWRFWWKGPGSYEGWIAQNGEQIVTQQEAGRFGVEEAGVIADRLVELLTVDAFRIDSELGQDSIESATIGFQKGYDVESLFSWQQRMR